MSRILAPPPPSATVSWQTAWSWKPANIWCQRDIPLPYSEAGTCPAVMSIINLLLISIMGNPSCSFKRNFLILHRKHCFSHHTHYMEYGQHFALKDGLRFLLESIFQSKKRRYFSTAARRKKSSLRSLNALPCKAFRAFDSTRGGLPPPRAPPPQLERIHLYTGFLTSCGDPLSFRKAGPRQFETV